MQQALAKELTSQGLRVLSVAPGWVDTGLMDQKAKEYGGKLHMKGRIITPEEIANVIYLLSGGDPINVNIGTAGGVSVGHTDLLITWLFKMTLGSAETKYYMASIIGILVFVVVAILSLIVYNVIPSTKNEEDYR